MNGCVKRNKFCRNRINSFDMPRSPMVWDICLADMMYEYVILSKDDENSESLAERILDFPRTVINPFDIF